MLHTIIHYLYLSPHVYRKHQTYESATLAQAANATAVSKEQDKQPQYVKRSACGDVYHCMS